MGFLCASLVMYLVTLSISRAYLCRTCIHPIGVRSGTNACIGIVPPSRVAAAYKTWGRRHNLDWIAQVDSGNMTHIIACTQTEQFGPSLFRSSEQGPHMKVRDSTHAARKGTQRSRPAVAIRNVGESFRKCVRSCSNGVLSQEQLRNNGTGGCHWKGQNRSLQKTADEKPAMIVRPHISQ